MSASAGWCGKLPVRADFVIRRLPLGFVEPWHAWLGEAMASLRDTLGADWLEAYLYGPIWRFMLPDGALGPSAMLGTLTPSVDKVGRYFPLTIAVPVESADFCLIEPWGRDRSWIQSAESLSLDALQDEVDLDRLDRRIEALPMLAGLPGAPSLGESDLSPEQAEQAVRHLAGGGSLWWTSGSEQIGPTVLLLDRLPPAAIFPTLYGTARP